MAETLQDPRIGTNGSEDVPRSLPERDLLGRPFSQIAIELPVGYGHFVVVPASAAPHLIAAALKEVKALVAEHYAPAEPVVEPPAPAEPEASPEPEKKRKGS